MRSRPVSGHGNQCCYDAQGRLITHGSGVGTADKVHGSVLTFPGHREQDMLPADWATFLDADGWGCFSELYLLVRPQVGAEKCDSNP